MDGALHMVVRRGLITVLLNTWSQSSVSLSVVHRLSPLPNNSAPRVISSDGLLSPAATCVNNTASKVRISAFADFLKSKCRSTFRHVDIVRFVRYAGSSSRLWQNNNDEILFVRPLSLLLNNFFSALHAGRHQPLFNHNTSCCETSQR